MTMIRATPMEAVTAPELPAGPEWQYEPKWDGFRCLAFRDGDAIELQSKAGQPLARYFPDVVEALRTRREAFRSRWRDGDPGRRRASFNDLLLRIHPAASRVNMLAETLPPSTSSSTFSPTSAAPRCSSGRSRAPRRLEAFAAHYFDAAIACASRPHTRPEGCAPLAAHEGGGLDGVVAKDLDAAYEAGERTGMQKIKDLRTADCVVGGFRYAAKGRVVGSLLLGLYDDDGLLHHVGFTSSIPAAERRELTKSWKSSSSRRALPAARRAAPAAGARSVPPSGSRCAQARGRSSIRPLHRRPLPPRHAPPALAARQGAGPVHHGAGRARIPISFAPDRVSPPTNLSAW